jgi:hypothetical protein
MDDDVAWPERIAEEEALEEVLGRPDAALRADFAALPEAPNLVFMAAGKFGSAGNDDHIVADLLTPFALRHDGREAVLRIVGGLLGHWSVWTRAAVELHARCRAEGRGPTLPAGLLALDAQVTEMNAAVFDVANGFHGVIAGCHEVLRRQGLLEGIWCLDPAEGLSPGQAELIEAVARRHPQLTDDAFVRDNLHRWLS